MKCRVDSVTRLGRRDDRSHGVRIPHFSHQNDVWIFSQCVLDSLAVGWDIGEKFPLMNKALRPVVDLFDRVFNCDDVLWRDPIDAVDDGI